MVLQVKGGNKPNPDDIKSLITTMHSLKAEMAGFICSDISDKSTIWQWAKEQGKYKTKNGIESDKVQILTIQDLLDGKKFSIPTFNLKDSDLPMPF